VTAFPKPAPRCKHRWSLVRVGRVTKEKVCVNCSRRRSVKQPKVKVNAPRSRIRPVSKKQRARLQLYAVARLRVIVKDGGCVACQHAALEIPCDGRGRIEVDHVDGRIGPLLLDESNMVSLHPEAHRHKTDHARACRPGLRAYAQEREAKCAAR
jgi:hypothetical protein